MRLPRFGCGLVEGICGNQSDIAVAALDSLAMNAPGGVDGVLRRLDAAFLPVRGEEAGGGADCDHAPGARPGVRDQWSGGS